MKKILFMMIAMFFVASCATSQTKVVHKYAHVTPDKINTCDTDNRWWMHLGGFGVVVLQFDNCLDVDKMLVMIAPTTRYTQEIRSLSYKLLGLHFVGMLNNTKPEHVWSLQLIRDFLVPANDANDAEQWIVVYKINSKPAKKTEGKK
jgi:hypothetical protein